MITIEEIREEICKRLGVAEIEDERLKVKGDDRKGIRAQWASLMALLYWLDSKVEL